MKMTWKIFWAYMAFVGLVAYRCFAQNIPYVDADSIKVVSNSLGNFAGLLTNDPNSNVNAQTVFDAIDDMMLPTSTNIVVNTNDWQTIDPTNNILQQSLDWIDDNWPTNIQNTNIYMTSEQSSNAFAGLNGVFISASGGAVSNKHMAANAVLSSNIADGTISISDIDASYLKMPRIAGYNAAGGDAICVACGSAAVGVVTTTQVTRSTLFGLYAYLAMTNVAVGADPLSLMYISAQISSNGTSWQTVDVGSAQVGFYTNAAAGGINFSSPAQIHWFVPASNYYKIEASAGSSLQAHQRWTCLWQRTYSVETGP